MPIETSTIEISRHKCLIYDGGPAEQLPVIVPLLMDGLQENWRCLYLGSPDMVEMVRSALIAKGIDVASETRRGAMIFSSDRSHLDDGFEPSMMIRLLSELIDDAVRDGFHGLCATGDMRWELGSDENFQKLTQYEALLEKLFRTKPLKGVCQYNRRSVPAQAVKDALETHRSLYVNSAFNSNNLFYLPPEMHLEQREQQAEWMCQQILRVLEAENKRDKALDALMKSEAEQRSLSERLAINNEDLEKRVQARTAELEAVNKDLEAFSYSVSHDLRAPLRAINGFSRILLEDFSDRLDKDGQESLGRIFANIHQMEGLIEGMLTLARLSKKEIKHETVNVSDIFRDEVHGLEKSEPGRKVKFLIEPNLTVIGDKILIRAALNNLISNAWKFTSKRTDACIEFGKLGDENGQVIFMIRDNGVGFDMAYAKKLFGVFERLHSQEEFSGTGVGLASVRRIINRHGGRVWAESGVNQGATFFFTLNGSESPITQS